MFFVIAGLLNDINMYAPSKISWTDLSVAVSGIPPSPRDGHGLAVEGGKLYVHGGVGNSGACLMVTIGYSLVEYSSAKLAAKQRAFRTGSSPRLSIPVPLSSF